MANPYKALSTVTVGSGGTASISFTNIPQNYTDLVIRVSSRTNHTNTFDYIKLTCNSDASGIYNSKVLYGNGGGTAAGTAASTDWTFGASVGNTATADVFGNAEIYITNYSAIDNPKVITQTGVGELNGSTISFQFATGGNYRNIAPITSITLTPAFGSLWLQHTTATLYGVFKSEIAGAPSAPTSPSAQASAKSALISFTESSNTAFYTVTSNPGSITATGTNSPILVTGLTDGTAYTFTVTATNPIGTSSESTATSSVTPSSTNVYESIATATPSNATVTFSNIPLYYTHLRVVIYGRNTNGNAREARIKLNYNSSVQDGYSTTLSANNVSTAINHNTTAALPTITGNSNTANQAGIVIVDIPNYSIRGQAKSMLAYGGFSDGSNGAFAGMAAVTYNTYRGLFTEMQVELTGGDFYGSGSRITLYGMK